MLIKEKGIWRVYNMELAPSGITESSNIAAEPKPVAKSTETAIEKVEVGTQRAADGKMLDARERFLSSTAEIKVSVYISGALKGQNVSAIWFYEGEQISQPIVNIIEEDGNFISQFKVSQPQNGWPMGKYKVVIMIDEGKKAKEVEYSIESV
jgi:hypothetical protein